MSTLITYDRANVLGQATALAVSTTVETDVVTITNPDMLRRSQLSIFLDVVLGSATVVTFGYYFSYDGGATWYKVPVKDLTTNKGELTDIPSYINSGSPSQVIASVTHYKAVEDVPTSGANAFKVTAISTTAAATSAAVTVAGRDN